MEALMRKWIAMTFVAAFWAGSAEAQVSCNECQLQANACNVQAQNVWQVCNAWAEQSNSSCRWEAMWNLDWCYQNCTYCHYCWSHYTMEMDFCDIQMGVERRYCDEYYDTTLQGCWQQLYACQATCT
jgi:hypothetical protein